jgi:hypothetical protein
MNTYFDEVMKRLSDEQGVDKNMRGVLAKAVKMQFVQELKDANEKERPFTKAYLAQKLHEKEHLDLALCNKTLDIICAALFEKQPTPPALAPQPTSNTTPRRKNGKAVYILLIIIFTLLTAVAAVVWYKVLHTKPEAPQHQEINTDQTVAEGYP